MSERLRAQLGLIAAALMLAGTMTIVYRGGHPAPPGEREPTHVHQDAPRAQGVRVASVGK